MNPSDNWSSSETNSQFRGPKLANLAEHLNILNHNFSSLGQAENNSVNQSETVEPSFNKTERKFSIPKSLARKGFFLVNKKNKNCHFKVHLVLRKKEIIVSFKIHNLLAIMEASRCC